jgi:HAD superfamily hydrolase (TIGR01484 family)
MIKKYQLLAMDMDGTLLNEQSEISTENERWIKWAMEQGITVCLATGRGYQSALPFARQLGLDSPMVLVNGSEVWASPEQLLHRTLMPATSIRKLRELAVQYDCWYWAYSSEGVYNKQTWLADDEDKEWLKFGFYTEDVQTMLAIREAIPDIGSFELTNSHPSNMELNPAGISKASGLRRICELLSMSMNDIIAVGDSLNDLAMIREAGLGVAMGNAQEVVKQAADATTLDHNQDAIAAIIQQYLK